MVVEMEVRTMADKTFKRHELKYFVSSEQYKQLCNTLSETMIFDEFCEGGDSYMIYNIYFDTENDDIIRHSLSKPYYKEKLRLRSYKMPTNGSDVVFLELKKKIGGIVAKRRAVMSYNEAMNFAMYGIIPEADGYQDRQVIKEISEFLARYTVKPKVYISYERTAFFHKEDKEFRVSFDRNIVTRRDQVNLTDGNFGSKLLPNDMYLMEVKCLGAVPIWMCSILSSMKLYKSSFSKYGTEFKRYMASDRVAIAS